MVRWQCSVHDSVTERFQSEKSCTDQQITHTVSRSFCLGTRCSNHHRQFQSNRGDTNVLSCKLGARSSLLEDLYTVQSQAAHENVYGSRYQWIILGYPSLSAWWHDPGDCSMQEMIRAINGTLQTRVPRLSRDKDQVSDCGIERQAKNNFRSESIDIADGVFGDISWVGERLFRWLCLWYDVDDRSSLSDSTRRERIQCRPISKSYWYYWFFWCYGEYWNWNEAVLHACFEWFLGTSQVFERWTHRWSLSRTVCW